MHSAFKKYGKYYITSSISETLQLERAVLYMAENMNFELLASSIKDINIKAGNAAKSAVNQLMTLRNWAIEYYRC